MKKLIIVVAPLLAMAVIIGWVLAEPSAAVGPPGTCKDDGLEQNDIQGGATAATLPYVSGGVISCEHDEDWYSFTLSAGQEIQVDAAFSHDPDADINIFLHAPDTTQVASSESTTDDEKITHTALVSGTFVVRVELFAISVPGSPQSTPYVLSLVKDGGATATPPPPTVTPGGPTVTPTPTATAITCPDDKLEPNDSEITGTEILLLPYSRIDLRACPDDPDWFVFNLHQPKEVQVDVIYDNSNGNIGLTIRGPGLRIEVETASDDLTVTFTAQADEDYRIGVTLRQEADGAPGNDYEIHIGNPGGTPTPTATLTPTATVTPTASVTTIVPTGTPTATLEMGSILVGKQFIFITRRSQEFFSSFDFGEMLLFKGSGCSGTELSITPLTYVRAKLGLGIWGVVAVLSEGKFHVEPGAWSLSPSPPPRWGRGFEMRECVDVDVAPGEVVYVGFTTLPLRNGDVNFDGETNSIDSALLLQDIAGHALPPRIHIEWGDVNEDGEIDSRDAALILQKDAGYIDALPILRLTLMVKDPLGVYVW